MILESRGLAALGLLLVVVVGNRWRCSKGAVGVEPGTLSEKSTPLVPDVESDIESKSNSTIHSSEDHSFVWRQELLVIRIALCSGLICIPLMFNIQNWTQWVVGTFNCPVRLPHTHALVPAAILAAVPNFVVIPSVLSLVTLQAPPSRLNAVFIGLAWLSMLTHSSRGVINNFIPSGRDNLSFSATPFLLASEVRVSRSM